MENLLANDLDYILVHTKELWKELQGQRIFVTGGTGFFGCWLLESFAWANDKLGIDASVWVLTRNPDIFREKAPHLASHPAIRFHQGDVRTFEFPNGSFSHIIHAATPASTDINEVKPLRMFETIVKGTQHVLEFARQGGTERLLLTSSGAVYGKQPPTMLRITEDYNGAPDTMDPRSIYGEGKRAAEQLCSLYTYEYGLKINIARCFTFLGPYLPLDSHFAIADFLSDGLNNRPIKVKGDGTSYRSYLYAADLVIWLWTILLKGQSNYPYNVGSEDELSIGTLARVVAEVFNSKEGVLFDTKPIPGRQAERYVPSTQRACKELDLHQYIDLRSAITRTIEWYLSMHKRRI